MPAFGFSVGDFVSAVGLITKITNALKKTGGANSEYQDAILELESLKNVLQRLQALEPNESNHHHVNAIRGMALACQHPLQNFLEKLERYESSMGIFSSTRTFRGAKDRIDWALRMATEVKNLRALVSAKIISVNLLLAIHASESVSRLESNTITYRNKLLCKIQEYQNGLDVLADRVEEIKDAVKVAEESASGSMSKQLEGSVLTQDKLDSIETFKGALMSIKNLGKAFPGSLLFEGLLRAEFKNAPGFNQVVQGQYHLLNVKQLDSIIDKEEWDRRIFPGSEITMSIILSRLQSRPGVCPRSSCGHKFERMENNKNLLCPECGLKYYPESFDQNIGFEDLAILDDEERVMQRQIAEDFKLFGDCSKLRDPEEVLDGSSEAVLKAPKRKWRELDSEIEDRSSETHKNPKLTHVEEKSGIDWRNGKTPIEAWLNQVAPLKQLPTEEEIKYHQKQRSEEKAKDAEKEEIELFRQVHLKAFDEVGVEFNIPLSNLELGVSIYQRNILDKFPDLPLFLARRLALANFHRAERLYASRQALGKHENPHISDSTATLQISASFLGPEKSGNDQNNDRSLKQMLPTARATHDFWSGGNRSYRTPSARSRSSSMNSSLRRDRHVDLEEGLNSRKGQNMGFKYFSKFIETEILSCPVLLPPDERSRSALPHPPVPLGKQKSFRCDICGQMVEIISKKAWQKHVLWDDLKPYVCCFKNCLDADQTFSTRKEFIRHQVKHVRMTTGGWTAYQVCYDQCMSESGLGSNTAASYHYRKYPADRPCLFCGEPLYFEEAFETHFGVHMEEISYAAVSRVCEEWLFYTDSSEIMSEQQKS
ncbi:MAG: hypothetical protein M1834_008533 [Cirrosporium novae-zelandiae]|nr:MAG: hypothetical protein M1834_008533 [Cirrosporium novae-zelandiae]